MDVGRGSRAGPVAADLSAAPSRPRRDPLATLNALAESGWGEALAFVWALGDSTFVALPVPPAEVVLAALAAAAPGRAWRIGLSAIAGTVLGLAAVYGVGAAVPADLRGGAVDLFPGVGDPAAVEAAVERRGGAAVLVRPPLGEPVGAHALAAGMRGDSILVLLVAGAARRGATLALTLGAGAALGRSAGRR